MSYAWKESLGWWPLGALDTVLLLIGTLLLAQACNLAWERRDILALMLGDEVLMGTLMLASWALEAFASIALRR